MKKQYLVASLLLGCSLFIACGNSNNSSEEGETEEKGALEKLSDAGNAIQSLSGMEKAMKEVEKHTTALKTKTPVNNDELKKVFPESLDGLKRTSISVGEMNVMNIATASADYANEDNSKTININIMDGAGEEASSLTALAFYGYNMDSEKITEDSSQKTTEYKGHRAKLTESKYNDETSSTIEWIHKNRYLMKIEGEGFTIDQVGNFMDKLDLGKLPD